MRKAHIGIFVVLLTVIFILNGCASFRLEKFTTDHPLSTDIPRLILGVNKSSFKSLYPDSLDSKGTWVEHGQEAAILLDRTSSDWFGNDGETWGYGIWRVTKRRTVVNYGWFLTSALTLFIPNIVGYPISSQKVYFGLELEVWDSRSKSIRIYTTESAETVYAAAYWGYNPEGTFRSGDPVTLSRAAHAKAVKTAIEDIGDQINRDAPRLIATLKSAGPCPVW